MKSHEPRPQFLDPPDGAIFAQPGRFLPRRLDLEDAGTADSSRRAIEATGSARDLVLRRVGAHVSSGEASWFECVCITVQEGDGMSWSAEDLAQALAAAFPNFKICPVSRSLRQGGLPDIAGIVPVRRFLQLVTRHKLSGSFLAVRPWQRATLLGLALLGSFLVHWGESAPKVYEGLIERLTHVVADGPFAAVTGAVAMLTLLAERLLEWTVSRPDSERIQKLGDEIEEQHEKLAYDHLVADLAGELRRGDRPRAVIVDGFDRLDRLTQRVVQAYFQTAVEHAGGGDIWVVLESPDGAGFAALAVLNRETFGFRHTRLYRQRLLTLAEREQLAAAIEKPERAEFTTVGAICATDPAMADSAIHFLRDYLVSHPRRPDLYSDLDLLYLLALATGTGAAPLDRGELAGDLAAKKTDPAAILRLFLVGSSLSVTELRAALIRIENELRRLLVVEKAPGATRLAVRAESRRSLEQHAGELGLPRAGLGHLFWALLRYNKNGGKAPQAYWIRQLAVHLAAADPAGIADPSLLRDTSRTSLEAILFTCRGALQTCVFEPLPALLEAALNLASDEDLAADARLPREIRRLSWRTYSLLGIDTLLATALAFQEAAAPPPAVAEPASSAGSADEPALQALFAASLDLAPNARSRVERALVEGAVHQDPLDALRVFPALRAALLSLTASATEPLIWRSTLVPPADCWRYLRTTLPAYCDRLLARAQDAEPLDLMALSIALDCLVTLIELPSVPSAEMLSPASAPEPAARALEIATEVPQATADAASALPPLAARGAFRRLVLDLLIDTAEAAVLLTATDRQDAAAPAAKATAAAARRVAVDFVHSALQRELAAAAVYALVLGARATGGADLAPTPARDPKAPEAPADWLPRMRDVIENAEPLAGPLPAVATAGDLLTPAFVAAVDRSLGIAAFLWRKFELEALHGLMQARRLRLAFRCQNLTSEDAGRYGQLLAPLGEPLGRADGTAVFLNLTLANLLADSTQLRASYLLAAADAVLLGAHGIGLETDFALLAVRVAHHLGTKLDRSFDILLREDDENRPILAAQLDALPDTQLEALAMDLLNAARNTANTTYDAVRTLLAGALHSQRREETRASLRDLLALHEAELRLRRDPACDANALLANWQGRRDTWKFASLLRACLLRGQPAPETLAEAQAALAVPPAELDATTAFYFLAETLVTHLLDAGAPPLPDSLPIAILQTRWPVWESQIRAEHNVAVFRALYRALPQDRPFYEAKLHHWFAIRLLADERGRLAHLRDAGRFYVLYRYYLEFLLSWGVALDCGDPAILHRRLTATPEDRQSEIRTFLATGAKLPKPLHLRDAATLIACDFVVLGDYLLNPPCATDPACDDPRTRLETAARQAIPDLLRLTTTLPRLPPSLRDIIRLHSERFLAQTLPDA